LHQVGISHYFIFINCGLWSGFGGGGGTFWLHEETMTFKGPAA